MVDTMIVHVMAASLSLALPRLHRQYMLHCHMMNHEELGMMQVVEVYAD